MSQPFKNKTVACFLAATFGVFGLHRFYLRGRTDPWAWAHLACVPLSAMLFAFGGGQPAMFLAAPLLFSAFSGFLEALVLGLAPDDKWDASHNTYCPSKSNSGWPLAVLLVLTGGFGAIALIATIARTLDLLFTGGAYG